MTKTKLVFYLINLIFPLFFAEAECRRTYQVDSSKTSEVYKNVVVEQVRKITETKLSNRTIKSSEKLKDFSEFLKDGIITIKDYNLSIRVPKLSSSLVSIDMGQFVFSSGEPPTSIVNFNEKSYWRASVSTIAVPWAPTGEEMLRSFEKQQAFILKSIPLDRYKICRISGSIGEGLEVLIWDEIPGDSWPRDSIKRSTTLRARTLGIRREIRVNEMVVEFFMIVVPPINLSVAEQENFARSEMNLFMSGFKAL